MGTGLTMIRRICERAERVQRTLIEKAFLPEEKKSGNRRWPITQVAKMVGKSRQAIAEAESTGRLPPPIIEQGRRIGYTLSEINKMREIFKTRPWRAPDEEPVIVAISNFKGGSAKSTTATHLSQYLAIAGYRILLVDMDPQASATATFGYNPDADIQEKHTVLPYFRGQRNDLKYAIRPTYWDGLDLIPSNLDTFDAEYEIAGNFKPEDLDLLKDGIAKVSQEYDVVVLDSPPALGMLSLNVLRAANALLIPVPPAMYDYYSTVSYLKMLRKTMTTMESRLGVSMEYKFIKMLITRLDARKLGHAEMVQIMESTYESYLLDAKLKELAEINYAAVRLYTVYELEKPERSQATLDRALSLLDTVFGEVERECIKHWPSRSEQLRDSGILA